MFIELRLNLQAPALRFACRHRWRRAGKGRRRFDPRLSTAFAERRHRPSPGTGRPRERESAKAGSGEQGAMR
jgi:hypothetical protein